METKWLRPRLPAIIAGQAGWLLAGLLVLSLGCSPSGQQSLAGGTTGQLRYDGAGLPDLQVNVFVVDAGQLRRIGYGITGEAGLFSLIDASGQRGLRLEPGHYHLTIESVAAEPIPIPTQYSDGSHTPLVREWTAADRELDLDVLTHEHAGSN